MSLTASDRDEIAEIVRTLIAANASQSNAATKTDIADLRNTLVEMRADMGEMRADLRREIAEVRREIAEAKMEVTKWYIGTMGIFAGLYAAINLVALRLMRP